MDFERIEKLAEQHKLPSGSKYMAIGIIRELESGKNFSEIAASLDNPEIHGNDPRNLDLSDQALTFIRLFAEDLGLSLD